MRKAPRWRLEEAGQVAGRGNAANHRWWGREIGRSRWIAGFISAGKGRDFSGGFSVRSAEKPTPQYKQLEVK